MTVSTPTPWPTSHLRAADAAFAARTCEPDPLTLDCDTLATATATDVDSGLLSEKVPLATLRSWLLAHPDNYVARDIVWRELVALARTGAPHWVIAAVGMAMPDLIRIAGQLAAGHCGDATDIDDEILTRFLQARATLSTSTRRRCTSTDGRPRRSP